ncbi:MAG: outer membrane beta-barrel protein [Verrucomicrobiota bacterium]
MRQLLLTTLLLSATALSAADLELKSLGAAAEGQAAKRKYGPYVGVSMGETMGQSGTLRTGGSLKDEGGAAIFSIEVGKSWKWKKLPIMTSLDVEGTFMSTTLTGDTVEADMNSLFFNLNGTIGLDLYRYRARIGKFAAGFRPYVGGGLGGGQVWYRNATSTNPTQSPFSIDEFVNSWNWYAGLEWTWKDQYSIFAEYRDFSIGDLQDLRGFSTDGYLVGFRYRY